MPTQLPSGRWRPRVRHPRTGKHINPQAVIGGSSTYEHEADARRAEDEARNLLPPTPGSASPSREFWDEWTTDKLWLRPAESTNLHNAERTRGFVQRYGDRPIRAIDDDVAREWLRGGRNRGTVPALRAFFNDASTAARRAARHRNPFAGLRLRQSRGRRDVQPPVEADAARLVALADELTPPSFAAYLAHRRPRGCAARRARRAASGRTSTSPRAPRRSSSSASGTRRCARSRRPSTGSMRTIAMTPPARDRLLALPRESEWVFTTLRGTHYTPSSRSHHWNRVRCGGRDGQRRPLHRHSPSLRVVRVERARLDPGTSPSTSAIRTAANWCASCTATSTTRWPVTGCGGVHAGPGRAGAAHVTRRERLGSPPRWSSRGG